MPETSSRGAHATGVFVLGMHRSGTSACTRMLNLLGCEVGAVNHENQHWELDSAQRINDDVLRFAGGTWRWTMPGSVERVLPRLPPRLSRRAAALLSELAGARTYALKDPRCCLTLPFWQRESDSLIYVLCYRHPLEVAMSLHTRDGFPLAVGIALWHLYTVSALYHTQGGPRTLVRYEELLAQPGEVASAIHDFLREQGAPGVHLAGLPQIESFVSPAERHERADSGSRDTRLTGAQRALVEQLEAGILPEFPEDPFANLDGDAAALYEELAALRRSRADLVPQDIDPSPIIAELGADLGRARAEALLLETQFRRLSSERDDLAERIREREAREALLRQALEATQARLVSAHAELNDLAALKEHFAAKQPTARTPSPERTAKLARIRRDRTELARKLIRCFRKDLFHKFSDMPPRAPSKPGRMPRVMVGTLSSGEHELAACVASVEQQRYRKIEHKVFSGLAKAESVATLMETFRASDCDLLIKVDADMVLTANDFVSRVVDVFLANDDIDMMQMAILDFFSGGPIQGINAYRRRMDWVTENQDRLFTDRTGVPADRRLVVWSTFLRDAIHSPDPSPFQAFHFGVHRGMKVLQPGARKFVESRAEEQLGYLEKTWDHFQLRRDRRLALACLGFELAVHGNYELAHLDYTNPALEQSFDAWREVDTATVEAEVNRLRGTRAPVTHVESVRERRGTILSELRRPVRTILVLLPHVGLFGGVNRFFELARRWAKLGVRCVIAQPDPDPTRPAEEPTSRPDAPDVEVTFFSEVFHEKWDVVLCGDALGGMMLTVPLFNARMVALYLLNGALHERFNRVQIDLLDPDVVIANSSYAAAPLAGVAPTVVAGGIDLRTFYPEPPTDPRPDGPLRLAVYPGRRKPVKRFEDAVEACRLLHARGIPVELHAYDESEIALDEPFPFVFHGALDKERLRALLSSVDIMLCPEEHAGWSNPAAEAMACGAVVVTTGAGATDFAIHEETALLVEPRKPEQIADAVERLYREPALRERLVAAGLLQIQAFDWSRVARNLLDTFSAARLDLDGRGKRNAKALDRVRRFAGLA